MRLLGCLSLFLCIVLLGISHKLKLERRSREWQEMKDLLRLCGEELQISHGNSEEILRTIWSGGFQSNFLKDSLNSEGSVQQKLSAAAKTLSDPKLREAAQLFAQRFGMSSLDLQLEELRTLQQICSEEYECSRKIAVQDGKLALNLSFFGGAAAVIILL